MWFYNIKISQYFPKPFGGNINFTVDLCNYATKTDIKNILHVDTWSFALKSSLASLKAEVDKLDTDKLVPVPVDLGKLSDVVKNDVVKKTIYDKLVAKLNSIDTGRFGLKTKYDRGKSKREIKFLIIVVLLKRQIAMLPSLKQRVKKIISGLATNSVLATVKIKIPNITSLVKKTDYDAKITEIENKITDHNHGKYITAPEFTFNDFNERLAQANLITKTDFDAKLSSLTRKITANKSNNFLLKMNLKS